MSGPRSPDTGPQLPGPQMQGRGFVRGHGAGRPPGVSCADAGEERGQLGEGGLLVPVRIPGPLLPDRFPVKQVLGLNSGNVAQGTGPPLPMVPKRRARDSRWSLLPSVCVQTRFQSSQWTDISCITIRVSSSDTRYALPVAVCSTAVLSCCLLGQASQGLPTHHPPTCPTARVPSLTMPLSRPSA